MAAPIFKSGTKKALSAETFCSRPRTTISAPSSRTQRNLNLSRFNVQEEDQPAPIKIVVSDPSSHPSLSLRRKRSLAVMKAKEFQSRLGSDVRSCYKMMVRSYVTGSSLGLPRDFCRSYLPKKSFRDKRNSVHFVLEDENKEQWGVRYFAYKSQISAGWRKFVLDNHLVVGDVLIFQLVKPRKFKVYIFKANNENEVDGSLSLMNVEAQTKQMALGASTSQPKRLRHTESLFSTVVPKKPRTAVRYKECIVNSGVLEFSRPLNPTIKNSTPRNIDLNMLPVPEEYQPSVIQIDYPMALEHSCGLAANSFPEVKTFEDFHIVLNGLCVDHEIPDDIRSGYYKLCLQEKDYPHTGISEHHSSMLVVGMIVETVNISLKIKNYSLITTTMEELDRWDNTLEAFTLLGMKVHFLRDDIHTLRTFMSDSEAAVDIKNYKEAANELKLIEHEITRADSKIRKLKQFATKFEENLCFFKQKVEKYKNIFQEQVDAPW